MFKMEREQHWKIVTYLHMSNHTKNIHISVLHVQTVCEWSHSSHFLPHFFMYWLFVCGQIAQLSSFVVTWVTFIHQSFLYWLCVISQTALLSRFVVTLATCIPQSFMFGLFVLSQITGISKAMVKLVTLIFHSFMFESLLIWKTTPWTIPSIALTTNLPPFCWLEVIVTSLSFFWLYIYQVLPSRYVQFESGS